MELYKEFISEKKNESIEKVIKIMDQENVTLIDLYKRILLENVEKKMEEK